MLFILLTGLVGLAAAFHFALRARKESLGFIKGMAVATLCGTLAASCADVGATLYAAEKSFDKGEGSEQAMHLVVEGLAESTSPGILGFSFLALSAMLVAVGQRRLDERTAA
ncbi:MAG: hypothetical protein KF850_22285 [Labilithrix sp.]|nr:hypothetical protein [Labilithrix sp.]MBX3214781.1 hypothetical protein [Labilithrix sp.]